MKMVLVPLDGSALAARALPYASAIARAAAGRLLLMRAVVANPYFKRDMAVAQMAVVGEADAYLEHIARSVRSDGVEVATHVPYGPPAREIAETALLNHVDLIVMSTHGRGGLGRWIYGSVADQVLRESTVPVLLVPAHSVAPWAAGERARLVIALDGSPLSEQVLGPGSQLADAVGADILLLRVVAPPVYPYGFPLTPAPNAGLLVDPAEELAEARRYLDEVARRLPALGHMVETRLEIGAPVEMIAAVARETGARAIAMASHGRGGLARLVLGSVATGTLQRANVPVLIVRAAGAPSSEATPAPADAATRPGASTASQGG